MINKCIICGREVFLDHLCKDCFLKQNPIIQKNYKLEIMKCKICNSINIKNQWLNTEITNKINSKINKINDSKINEKIRNQNAKINPKLNHIIELLNKLIKERLRINPIYKLIKIEIIKIHSNKYNNAKQYNINKSKIRETEINKTKDIKKDKIEDYRNNEKKNQGDKYKKISQDFINILNNINETSEIKIEYLIKVKYKNKIISQIYSTNLIVKNTICPTCNKKLTKYYEAILQIRINDFNKTEKQIIKRKTNIKHLIDLEVEKKLVEYNINLLKNMKKNESSKKRILILKIINMIVEQELKKHINKEIKIKKHSQIVGYNYYITNKSILKTFIRKINNNFNVGIKKSEKTYSYDREHSKKISRLTINVEFK